MLLSKMWKMDSVPTVKEWKVKVDHVFLMSKLSAISKNGWGLMKLCMNSKMVGLDILIVYFLHWSQFVRALSYNFGKL